MAAQRVRTVSTPLLSHHHHIFCSRITTLPARLNELTHVLPLTKDTQMQGSSVAPPFQPVYTLTSSPPSWSILEGLHFGKRIESDDAAGATQQFWRRETFQVRFVGGCCSASIR